MGSLVFVRLSLAARVLTFVLGVALLPSGMAYAQARGSANARNSEDLARARALDQQGAKAYGEGRYNDAIRYFEEAHRLGGPPFELWNVARCYVKLDQPEQAAEMIERYLDAPGLPQEDRDEATGELDALRRRPSTVTIVWTPPEANVTLDGKPLENTRPPASFTVTPGPHAITVSQSSYVSYTQRFEAKFGRAVILNIALTKDESGSHLPPREPELPDTRQRKAALRGHLGIMLPRYGTVGGSPSASLTLSGFYRAFDAGAAAIGVGGLLSLTGDAWDNRVGAATSLRACGVLRNPREATALSLFGALNAGFELSSRLHAHARAGGGLAAYFGDQLGGDLFVPTCSSETKYRPAVMVGGQIDYALTRALRLSALPLLLQIQPSFPGTRGTPIDASGMWLRATIAVGIGVDL